MMQEVSGDDTNGESTFEFVDRKLDDLQIGSTNAPSDSALGQGPSHSNLRSTSAPLAIGTATVFHQVPAETTMMTPSLASQPISAIPPPAALPAFLVSTDNQTANLAQQQQVSLIQNPAPIYSTSEQPSQPSSVFAAQPSQSFVSPSAYSIGQQHSYSPGLPSTALELPLTDYSSTGHSQQGLDSSGNTGVWSWIKGTVSGNDFLSKVAEKAKNSVDSMITTLDPQMKEYIYSGGDISIIVASDKDNKITPIREAFQFVFGRATIDGIAAQANIAVQPVGFSASLKGAEDRISFLRQSGLVHERQPIIAVENFLAELTPERWYDIGCLVLDDPTIGSALNVYTQATPIPLQYVQRLQADTPSDYPLRWSGFANSIGNIVGQALQVPHTEWHQHLSGISRREMLLLAAKTLATTYKQNLDRISGYAASATKWH